MTTLKKLSKRQTGLIAVALFGVFLILLLILLRGFIRTSVFPAYVSWRYEARTKDAYEVAKQELSDPVNALGLRDVVNPISNETPCDLYTAGSLRLEGGCFYGSQFLRRTVDNEYLKEHEADFGQLQSALDMNGWVKAGYRDDGKSAANLLEGSVPYGHVSLRYDKEINGVSCWLNLDRWEPISDSDSASTISSVLTCRKDLTIGL